MITENGICHQTFACCVQKREITFRFCESVLISLVGLPERDGILQENYLIIDQGLGIGHVVVV